jgi:hypothetical protein
LHASTASSCSSVSSTAAAAAELVACLAGAAPNPLTEAFLALLVALLVVKSLKLIGCRGVALLLLLPLLLGLCRRDSLTLHAHEICRQQLRLVAEHQHSISNLQQ